MSTVKPHIVCSVGVGFFSNRWINGRKVFDEALFHKYKYPEISGRSLIKRAGPALSGRGDPPAVHTGIEATVLMNILLTNDDGIHSRGLEALYESLSAAHEVYIIAPDGERSACSNAITVRHDLSVQTLSEGRYSVNGYPADCVNVGLHGGLLPAIDLVISGINHGPNLGDDIYFSGTTAGARTAFIFGVSGIALSLDCMGSSDHFGGAADFMATYIDDYPELAELGPLFLNINYPDLPAEHIAGVRYTSLGKRRYRDSYNLTGDGKNGMSMRLEGRIESDEIVGSDAVELRKGYISITPLGLDCTDHAFLRRFSERGVHG